MELDTGHLLKPVQTIHQIRARRTFPSIYLLELSLQLGQRSDQSQRNPVPSSGIAAREFFS
jgi:hypothetical protein